jgi:hypothetical protein
MGGQGMKDWEKPSVKQINYAHSLAEELRIEDNYNWNELTKQELSELIDGFKDRLGYK